MAIMLLGLGGLLLWQLFGAKAVPAASRLFGPALSQPDDAMSMLADQGDPFHRM